MGGPELADEALCSAFTRLLRIGKPFVIFTSISRCHPLQSKVLVLITTLHVRSALTQDLSAQSNACRAHCI